LGAGLREADAEIQSGGDFIRIDRPGGIDQIFINHLVGFSKIAQLGGNKIRSDQCYFDRKTLDKQFEPN
jgi:hypothetical protein